jgi:hypothetical protein
VIADLTTRYATKRFCFPEEDDMAGTAFGLGSPFMSATTPLTWGLSPYGIPGQGINPIGLSALSGPSAYTMQPQQQIHQLLQIVPQQLQQIQQLLYVQQQQLQQLMQIVPAQLVQLQQLIQLVAQPLQQMQQPLGQAAGTGGFAVTPWGITPQPFGAQPAQVM